MQMLIYWNKADYSISGTDNLHTDCQGGRKTAVISGLLDPFDEITVIICGAVLSIHVQYASI